VASRGEVRRAKLYYLRDRVGRSARVRERRYTGEDEMEGVMPPEGLEEQIEDVAPPTEAAEGEADPDAGDAPAEEAPAAEPAAESATEESGDGDAEPGEEPAAQEDESPGQTAS
jgi:large subunit ribosomal protein L19